MKESYWGYWIIILGIFIVGVMLLVNNTTTNSTQDYYTLKEVTHAAMVDAVDMSYYRLYGNVKMSEQKFVENFIRRFADNTNLANTYNVEFYDLYEVPPKVSVKVSTKSNSYNVAMEPTQFDITNTIDAILEFDFTKYNVNDGGENSEPCPLIICRSFINDYYSGSIKSHADVANSIFSKITASQKEQCYQGSMDGNSMQQCSFVKDAFNSVIDGITASNALSNPVVSDWINAGYLSTSTCKF